MSIEDFLKSDRYTDDWVKNRWISLWHGDYLSSIKEELEYLVESRITK